MKAAREETTKLFYFEIMDLGCVITGSQPAKDIAEAERILREIYGVELDCFPDEVNLTVLKEAENLKPPTVKIGYCPKCHKPVIPETDPELKKEYPYLCPNCDENMYEFEVIWKQEGGIYV